MMSNQELQKEGRRRPDRQHDLVRAVVVAVREEVAAQSIPDDMHREHHAYLVEVIDEKRRKRERAEKIKAQVGGWAIITALSGLGTAAYQGFNWIREHMK
ncbi:hypothetical protein [Janthinobacterium sp. CG_S6]|uniref:hypothetical protein n=1 Tax=Janthinobacterium sp. CG_S6 TaxID=3071707 RepID=UPI002E05CDA2|nr:hypothetical protein [Janthinobacterium sp. CG_S6]